MCKGGISFILNAREEKKMAGALRPDHSRLYAFALALLLILVVLWGWLLIGKKSREAQLIAAIKAGDRAAVEQLLKAGASPDAREGAMRDKLNPIDTGAHPTALMVAGFQNEPEIVLLLLQFGAKIGLKDRREDTPLLWAIRGGSVDSCRLLLDHGADVEEMGGNGRSPLRDAALRGDTAIVSLLLSKGALADAADPNGDTALMYAADAATAELLLQSGANVNAKGTQQLTPLMYAVDSGEPRPALVRLLIRYKADVHAVDANGRTALMKARAHGAGHQEIVEILLAAGAKK